ncbi:hypothetical protein [Roseateles noduli]|uniref:hypothetical protein n=1 Tax=Roseateles noduli TaxID=2052484 RepID=UPI003D65059F
MSLTTVPSVRRPIAADVLRVVAAVVLFHLPLWAMGMLDQVSRPIFNLDAFVALAIACRYRRAGAVLLVLVWLLDVMVSLSLNYHFRSPAAFLASARFGQALDIKELFSLWDAVMAAGFVVAFLALTRLLREPVRWIGFGGALVGLLLLDVLNGSSLLSNRDVRLIRANLAGSPTVVLAIKKETQPLMPLATPAAVALHRALEDWARAHPDGSTMLVLVESLGVLRDPALRQWLDSRLTGHAASREIRRAPVQFIGPTTYGELRTLCLLTGSYQLLDDSHAEGCLPMRLSGMGWHSIGMHGFTGNMFDRRMWWPAIGFDESLFAEQLAKAGLPQCGAAFRGHCDGAVLEAAGTRLKPSTFVYVVTLNTHLPLQETAIPTELAPLCAAAGVTDSVCQLTAALGHTLQEVGRQMQAHPESLFVVSGDHAPPFRVRAARQAFEDIEVPSWILAPKAP